MSGEAAAPKVIAVTSAKGGVGKTSVCVNLAVALATRARRVMLLDADLGHGNVDLLLGLRGDLNLSHVMAGQCSVQDIVLQGPAGVRVVPAAPGQRAMTALGEEAHAALIRAFSDLDDAPELLVIDTAAGFSASTMTFATAAQQVVVVVSNEPASLSDAWALIRLLHAERAQHDFHVLANMTRSAAEGKRLFLELLRLGEGLPGVSLDYLGAVPFDRSVQRAVQGQRAVVEASPRSRAASAFRQLATVMERRHSPVQASGKLEFFLERVIQGGFPYAEEARP